jgi:ubiquinone biosynthesis monooxygenase Coq7
MRHYSRFDQVILGIDKLFNPFNSNDSYSAALMRVNHSGEVCAQALYEGQALVAKDPELATELKTAALEEQEHLLYCERRIAELEGRTSYLNPLWAAGSYGIGMLAGLCGDKISLGFLAETEYQVVRHLEEHMNLLPDEDLKSREILSKMRDDELRHATNALDSGGIRLPRIVKLCMTCTAKIMTFTAKYI